MKLWVIPAQYDYHEQAEYVVMAETRDEALAKLQAHIGPDDGAYRSRSRMADSVNLEGVYEHGADVYQNEGCDC